MRSMLIAVSAVIVACGPNIEKDCETICEKLAQCGAFAYSDTGVCMDNCESAAEDSDKCADANQEYADCVDDVRCSSTSCGAEESDVVDTCFK